MLANFAVIVVDHFLDIVSISSKLKQFSGLKIYRGYEKKFEISYHNKLSILMDKLWG